MEDTITFPENNINMPSMPQYTPILQFDGVGTSMPEWDAAYANLKTLPGQIDNWSNEAMKYQRGTGDQISSILGNLMERGPAGIGGGTEKTALQSKYLTDFSRVLNDNKMNIMNNANNMKAQAISAMPGQAMQGVNAQQNADIMNMNNQYNYANLNASNRFNYDNMNMNNQYNWANLAANDEYRWADLAARMLTDGY